MSKKDVLVVGAMRSPIGNGRSDSSLFGITPQDLACQVLEAQFLKVPVPRESVQSFRLGSVVSLKSGAVTQGFAKEISIRAGMYNASSSVVEKVCSSGLRAIYEASSDIRNEGCDFAIGAGVDLMSGVSNEVNVGALTDPITGKSMAVLSDGKARELGLTSEDYDRYAVESYTRAKKHLYDYERDGYLAPVVLNPLSGSENARVVNFDQNVMISDQKLEKMKKMLIGGCEITTAFNASKYGDGYGNLVLASPRGAKKMHLEPLAKILAYEEHAERESKDFIIAPVGAVTKAVKRAKKTFFDIDAWWVNEAFPGSPLYFVDKIPEALWENVNPAGGAIAFGHALGATGAILCVNAICHAKREKQKYIVVSLCNAIGEATAMVFEIM
ncbi:hypothetical protein A2924_01625 [Candidatus Giovannonibacteria bacterium RIFCSPLOWO2_01_FULL_44_16]|uniref:Acetyl-CoA acetyltransferase n=1 Tax=Candidatus Giovannonibacteria bacterium RIFCSPLOWO2_01_FULL_44_16 TaxID=1798348 RepID=A0A1F5X4S4_9BACT|nr:MAG: hypothetical protein A2924_01625 [Candidatus Giovannonibacteria bacterium RIFCSPLOWO2_01_FULL_44_16]